ncbi:MAG: peptide-binding protein [Pseudooceanicola sp.]|jgi:uncharacterized protein YraI|nr:peptide-binding protein [Pseudooceanicola sp.]|tara:strand:+ start:806 stop:1090 length:285 start_codon:yes stop_codon:yes gene_type:complete
MRWAAIVVSGTVLLAGCAGVMGERAVVTGVGQGDLLKLRYGPSLGYKVKLGLPDGTEVVRRTCVTEMGQLWCEVSLAKDPGVTGYVSADYLTKP